MYGISIGCTPWNGSGENAPPPAASGTVSVKQYDVEAMRGQLATEIRRFDSARSHEYAMAFHDDDCVMSNLLCALLS